MRQFIKTYGLTFPVGLDGGMTIANAYRFVGTPMTVIISRDGAIVDKKTGPQNEKILRQKIEKFLK